MPSWLIIFYKFRWLIRNMHLLNASDGTIQLQKKPSMSILFSPFPKCLCQSLWEMLHDFNNLSGGGGLRVIPGESIGFGAAYVSFLTT